MQINITIVLSLTVVQLGSGRDECAEDMENVWLGDHHLPVQGGSLKTGNQTGFWCSESPLEEPLISKLVVMERLRACGCVSVASRTGLSLGLVALQRIEL